MNNTNKSATTTRKDMSEKDELISEIDRSLRGEKAAPMRSILERSRDMLNRGGMVPPHDLDAEAVVLSAMMLDADALSKVANMLQPSDFYSDPNKRIFEACLDLRTASSPVDIMTVGAWMRARGLSAVVEPKYLVQICDATPSVANVEAHAQIVRDASTRRIIIAEAQRVAAEGYGTVESVSLFAGEVLARFSKISQSKSNRRGVTGREAIEELFEDIRNPNTNASGTLTGIRAFDRKNGRMPNSSLTLVLAYTGHGKSAFCSSLATNVATSVERVRCKGTETTQPCGWKGPNPMLDPSAADMAPSCHCGGELVAIKQGVIIFSCEMKPKEYMMRMIASWAAVDYRKVKNGTATRDELRSIAEAASILSLDSIKVENQCRTIEEVYAAALAIAADMINSGIEPRLVIIDYAQRYKSSAANTRAMTREQEVANVGIVAKDLAMKLDVPVLMPAQLNDDANKAGVRPSASNVRECKALAMDADNVVIIYNEERSKASAQRDDESRPVVKRYEPADLIVDKWRGGEPGTVRVGFIPNTTTFCDWDQAWGDPSSERRRA